MKRILAIDPGYDRLGVSIIDKGGNVNTLVFSTTIVTDRKHTHTQRLNQIGEDIKTIINQYCPSEMAIESIFFTKNSKTLVPVSEARGVVFYIASITNIPVFEYSPPSIKVAVTGYGKATKNDILFMVPKLIKLPDRKMLDDEIDAIAIGITHLAIHK